MIEQNQITFPRISIFTAKEVIEEKKDLIFMCLFCCKYYHFINDGMVQEILDSCNNKHIESEYQTSGLRCKHCVAKKRVKTFDGRKIADPKRMTGAESAISRPLIWYHKPSGMIVGKKLFM